MSDRVADRGREQTLRLLIHCHDRPGIVAAVSSFLFERGANILESDQYSTDPRDGQFLMRMVFRIELGCQSQLELGAGFEADVARRFDMEWRMANVAERKRLALMASREGHCLLDLLWRWRSGELDAKIVVVVSNHRDLAEDVRPFNVPYFHVPVERGRKAEAERKMLDLIAGKCDVVVLARYMQVLSGEFLADLAVPVINIHHSFLPAFAGADPYRRAHERGVKIIGATAHYVTEELDAGPIIEQDVVRTTHRPSVGDLERMGADIERTVLARSLKWHLEDRLLVYDNKTVVF
jgi:formyltetrahydrofolate deformylase